MPWEPNDRSEAEKAYVLQMKRGFFKMSNRLQKALFIAVAGLSPFLSAVADDTRAFYQSNFAINWDESARPTSSNGIKFDAAPVKKSEADEDQFTAEKPSDEKSEIVKKFYPAQPKDRDSIVSEYGNPTEDRNIVPRGDAPPEFMGMSAALNIGDEKLAFEYARAYARRMKRLQDFVDRASEYNTLALEAEGMSEGFDPKNPSARISPERQKLMNEVELAKKERLRAMANTKFDEKAQALLAEQQAEAFTSSGDPSSDNPDLVVPPELSPPIDPEGRVRVLVFFTIADLQLHKFILSMDSLAARLKKRTSKVEIILLSTERLNQQQLQVAKSTLDTNLKVQNGERLAEYFKVVKVPTTILVAQTTQEIFPMEGTFDDKVIEQVIDKMQGGNL